MRIIGGQFRSRRLLPPEGMATRPITDRVKQSLFDILTGRIEGAMVLDLFAGTGSLGLEALSRGAAGAWFFEADRSALVRLRRNLADLGLGPPGAVVVAGDVFGQMGDSVGEAGKMPAPQSADIIFLDPPYSFLAERPDDLRTLALRLADHALAPGGVVVFRHSIEQALELPPLALVDQRDYGLMRLDFLARP
jgi:16S rRNA (guanine966-N2)-methyltransferase